MMQILELYQQTELPRRLLRKIADFSLRFDSYVLRTDKWYINIEIWTDCRKSQIVNV